MIRRHKDILEGNSVGIDKEDAAKIVNELDVQVATLTTWFHQLQKHHWLVEGPQFRDLHLFFEDAYEKIHGHFDVVAERITQLGGIPVSHPAKQAEEAYIEHESEGLHELRSMLEKDLGDAEQISISLTSTVNLARDLEDYVTEKLIKDVLVDVQDIAHHLEHYVADESL